MTARVALSSKIFVFKCDNMIKINQQNTAWKMSYHGVTHNEDRQVRVAGLHQVNVLQGVSDVDLEVFDVHPVSFTLAMPNCGGKRHNVRKQLLL